MVAADLPWRPTDKYVRRKDDCTHPRLDQNPECHLAHRNNQRDAGRLPTKPNMRIRRHPNAGDT